MVLHSRHYGDVFGERFGNFKIEGTMEMVLSVHEDEKLSHSSFLQATGHLVLAWPTLYVSLATG